MAQIREDLRHAPDKERTRAGKPAVAEVATPGSFVMLHSGDDVTPVPLTKAHYGRIVDKTGVLRKVIAKYADTAAKAKRTGQSFVVSYRVAPSGEIEVVREAPAGSTNGSVLDAAIARAKDRGAAKAADILKGAEMLTARDFGPLIGASHETVNTKRKRHEILGLEGATRGIKYPRWQVTESGLPLPGLTQLFGVLGQQPWTVYRFLRTVHTELGGRMALDALKAGEVEAVVNVARNQAAGAFS